MLYALRPMRVDGQQRQPGDAVPEAYEWKNLHTYINGRRLEEADRPSIEPQRAQDDEDAAPEPEPPAMRESPGESAEASAPANAEPGDSQTKRRRGRPRKRA